MKDDFDDNIRIRYSKRNRRGHRNKDHTGIIILMCVVAVCVLIVCTGLLINRGKAQNVQENEFVFKIEELDTTTVIDKAVSEVSIESELDEDAGTEEESTEETEDTSKEDNDPQAATASDKGAEIDIAQLVSSSSVDENSSVTHGIDVSRFQGTIDWAQVAGAGIDFVMVRVGYRDSTTGEIKADSNAKYNMQEAEKNGIKIGAYFFSTAISNDEAKEEAKWVANFISKYPITYPVGFNCEGFDSPSSRQYSLSKVERSSIAMTFLDQVYSAGYTPIFYASRGELFGDAQWITSQIENKYKIWMAWYNQDTSDIASGPSYEGQCAMWQYSNNGTVAGISKSVDVDVAYFGYNGIGTAKDTSERETVSADVEALMSFKSVDETVTAKNSTNLRNKPSQGDDSTIMTTLQNGQTAQRTGISDSGWSRVDFEGNTYYAVSSFLTTDLAAPKQEEQKQEEETSGFRTKFSDCNENVTAKDMVNLRTKPSVTDEDSAVVASLYEGDIAVRTGVNMDYGWSRVEYNGQTLYCISSYLKVVE